MVGVDAQAVTVRDLMDLLGDADRDVRLRSALALGEGRHERAAPALVARFADERDFAVRETLTWAVLRIPDVALPLVRAQLQSPRWLARLQATHTLSKVGAFEDGRRLLDVIGDPIDCVAARAYWAAAQCGDPIAIPAMVAELSRGSSEHQNSLLVALSLFGAPAVPALVVALCRGATPPVRRHAADTLAYLGSPLADPAQSALIEAGGDPDDDVRIAALNALGQLVLPEAWNLIDEMVASPHHRLRLLAVRLAERRPADAVLLTRGHQAAPQLSAEDLDPAHPDPRARNWSVPDLGLVTCEGGPLAEQLAPALALQVQVCRPQYLSRPDVPEDVLDAVHAAAFERARGMGRARRMALRIAAGAVEQFIHDNVFLEQVSVADPGVTVGDLLYGTEVHITWFERLERPTSWR